MNRSSRSMTLGLAVLLVTVSALGGCGLPGPSEGEIGESVVFAGPYAFADVVAGGRAELAAGLSPAIFAPGIESEDLDIVAEDPLEDDERRFVWVLAGCAEKGAVLTAASDTIEPRLADNGNINCAQAEYFLAVFDVPRDDLPTDLDFLARGLGTRIIQVSADPDGPVDPTAVELGPSDQGGTVDPLFANVSLPELADATRRFGFVSGGCRTEGAFLGVIDGRLARLFPVQEYPDLCESEQAYLTVFDVLKRSLPADVSIG